MLRLTVLRTFARLTTALAVGAAASLAFAQTPPVELTAEELAAIGEEPLRAWELTGNLRGAFGYKENLLLSAIRSENSAFAQAEAEVFWWRLPTERFEALAFTNATLTRYFASDTNPREWQAFAHGEAKWFASPTVQITGLAEAYHLDQIFDLSATTAEHLVARLAVTGAVATTALRWQVRPHTWLEIAPSSQRDRYRDASDDNWQHMGRLAAGRTLFNGRAELAVSAQALRRRYDDRPQYSVAGRPLVGTELIFDQQEVEASVSVTWDEAKRWRSTTSAAFTANEDNGSGFFDYDHSSIRHEITWTRAPWNVRLTGRAGRYDYKVQIVGIGINPPRRRKDEYVGQIRIERELSTRARLYIDYLAERSRSNDPLANYRVNTAAAGLDWAF